MQLVLQHRYKTSWKAMYARFTTHVQTSLATNQIVAGCENLLQKVESSSTFCNKLCKCCAFYGLKANLFCSNWRNSSVWRDSRVILSNQKSVFTELAATFFFLRQVWTWVVKRATSLFNLFCSNVAKQVALFGCPCYHAFMLAHFLSCFETAKEDD